MQGNQLFGPYGKGRYSAGSINTAKGFIGQYNDSLTGLDYFHARYYDPVAGVFLSADKVQGNWQGMDPYGYVNGNPETRSDPSGQYIPGPGGEHCYIGGGGDKCIDGNGGSQPDGYGSQKFQQAATAYVGPAQNSPGLPLPIKVKLGIAAARAALGLATGDAAATAYWVLALLNSLGLPAPVSKFWVEWFVVHLNLSDTPRGKFFGRLVDLLEGQGTYNELIQFADKAFEAVSGLAYAWDLFQNGDVYEKAGDVLGILSSAISLFKGAIAEFTGLDTELLDAISNTLGALSFALQAVDYILQKTLGSNWGNSNNGNNQSSSNSGPPGPPFPPAPPLPAWLYPSQMEG